MINRPSRYAFLLLIPIISLAVFLASPGTKAESDKQSSPGVSQVNAHTARSKNPPAPERRTPDPQKSKSTVSKDEGNTSGANPGNNKENSKNPQKYPSVTGNKKEATTTPSTTEISKPAIIGSVDFTGKVTEALGLLKNNAPSHYVMVQKYLTQVAESANSGVDVNSGVFYLGWTTVFTSDIYWLAGVIVHDASHVEAYRLGQSYAGREGEERAIQVQKEVLQLLDAPPDYQDYLDTVMSSEFWDIPFEQRNW
ncbi:MAG: hypothetical protein ACYC2T_01715 [Bacillota bacterium]